MTSILFVLLIICLFISTIAAAGLWLAWLYSRRANATVARRLDAESQIEVATMHTLAAMREATRRHMRGDQ